MDIEQAFQEAGENVVDLEFNCHDCGKPVRVRATKDEEGIAFEAQDGAAGYFPELSFGEREYFAKCPACYQQKPQLTDFNPTEVFTRVVGYYRPVQAFNVGKKAEYKDRQNYHVGG